MSNPFFKLEDAYISSINYKIIIDKKFNLPLIFELITMDKYLMHVAFNNQTKGTLPENSKSKGRTLKNHMSFRFRIGTIIDPETDEENVIVRTVKLSGGGSGQISGCKSREDTIIVLKLMLLEFKKLYDVNKNIILIEEKSSEEHVPVPIFETFKAKIKPILYNFNIRTIDPERVVNRRKFLELFREQYANDPHPPFTIPRQNYSSIIIKWEIPDATTAQLFKSSISFKGNNEVEMRKHIVEMITFINEKNIGFE